MAGASSHVGVCRQRMQICVLKNLKFENERVDNEVDITMRTSDTDNFFCNSTRFLKVINNCCILFVDGFSIADHRTCAHCYEDQTVPYCSSTDTKTLPSSIPYHGKMKIYNTEYEICTPYDGYLFFPDVANEIGAVVHSSESPK